jgi:hypothetical protein
MRDLDGLGIVNRPQKPILSASSFLPHRHGGGMLRPAPALISRTTRKNSRLALFRRDHNHPTIALRQATVANKVASPDAKSGAGKGTR